MLTSKRFRNEILRIVVDVWKLGNWKFVSIRVNFLISGSFMFYGISDFGRIIIINRDTLDRYVCGTDTISSQDVCFGFSYILVVFFFQHHPPIQVTYNFQWISLIIYKFIINERWMKMMVLRIDYWQQLIVQVSLIPQWN